ncbi:hypothetical protein NDU88_006890 [Pleurodeles waltl]|uniref:Uncharacterized protein n=1 Tax=Pleurodeles waltl TaxID=8319 RepID=A0AAV7MDI5_PLEWA|nr:hypothetical protein NDU88_006890 [Pleurodeles waltl]
MESIAPVCKRRHHRVVRLLSGHVTSIERVACSSRYRLERGSTGEPADDPWGPFKDRRRPINELLVDCRKMVTPTEEL